MVVVVVRVGVAVVFVSESAFRVVYDALYNAPGQRG